MAEHTEIEHDVGASGCCRLTAHLLADIESCARATAAQSWPMEMGEVMRQRAERVRLFVEHERQKGAR